MGELAENRRANLTLLRVKQVLEVLGGDPLMAVYPCGCVGLAPSTRTKDGELHRWGCPFGLTAIDSWYLTVASILPIPVRVAPPWPNDFPHG